MKAFGYVAVAAVVLAVLGVQSWFCRPALADKVYLKNNEIMEGLVTRETENDVTLDFGFGQMTLDRKNIVKIEKCPFGAKEAEKAAPAASKKEVAKPQVKLPPPAPKPAPPKKPEAKLPAAKPPKAKEAPLSTGAPGAEAPPAATPPAQDTGTTTKK